MIEPTDNEITIADQVIDQNCLSSDKKNEPVKISLKNILDYLPQAIVVTNEKEEIIFFNQPFEELFQSAKNYLSIGSSLDTLWQIWNHSLPQEVIIQKSGVQLPNRINASYFLYPHPMATGENKWIGILQKPLPLGYIIRTFSDITQPKNIELVLAQTRNFLEAIIDHLPLALFVKNGQAESFGELLLWNKTSELMFGIAGEDIIGKKLHNYFPKEQADFFEQIDRETFQTGIPNITEEEPIQGKRKFTLLNISTRE